MYLIDSSVWIDFFRGKNNFATQFLKKIIASDMMFGLTGIIYQEVLQGAATEKDFQKIQQYLSKLVFYTASDTVKTYEAAAWIYFKARKKGITIRSTVDCFIAQIAIDNKLVLLHHDKDYNHIQKIDPRLQLAP